MSSALTQYFDDTGVCPHAVVVDGTVHYHLDGRNVSKSPIGSEVAPAILTVMSVRGDDGQIEGASRTFDPAAHAHGFLKLVAPDTTLLFGDDSGIRHDGEADDALDAAVAAHHQHFYGAAHEE